MNSTPTDRESLRWLENEENVMDARYRAARRHSSRVRILKIILPLTGVVAVLFFLGYFFGMPNLPAGFGAGAIDVTNNSIIMKDPHVSGYLSGGRSYELRADKAEQSLANTKVVNLQNIGATIGMGQGESAHVLAAKGTYYSDAERIVLDGDITFKTTTGIEGALQSADIDLKGGTMTSDKPLAFHSAGSEIHAKGVSVSDRGQTISFVNGVRVTYSVSDESSNSTKRVDHGVTE